MGLAWDVVSIIRAVHSRFIDPSERMRYAFGTSLDELSPLPNRGCSQLVRVTVLGLFGHLAVPEPDGCRKTKSDR